MIIKFAFWARYMHKVKGKHGYKRRALAQGRGIRAAHFMNGIIFGQAKGIIS